MFWEMAGDYAFDPAKNEYGMGSTLTTLAYEVCQGSQVQHPAERSGGANRPARHRGEPLRLQEGDSNHPINPTLKLTNNSTQTIPGGTRIEFLVPTSASDTITDQSGMGLKVVESGGNQNSDGIAGEGLPQGGLYAADLEGVGAGQRRGSGDDLLSAGRRCAKRYPHHQRDPDCGPQGRVPDPAGGGAGQQWWRREPGGATCSSQNVNPAAYKAYPTWPQGITPTAVTG